VQPGAVGDRRAFTGRDWALFVGAAALHGLALLWAARRVAAVPGVWTDPVTWVALLPSIGALVAFDLRWLSMALMRVPATPVPDPTWRVALVTTFVPGLEPLDMLRRTVAAMVAVRGEHDTWVLDEGDDAEVRALCDALGARHFSRRGVDRYQQRDGTFQARSKHGNYNAWLDAVGYGTYDVVVGFDPDHVPAPHFLDRTLGHLRDDRIGYVQAAQAYYNQPASFIARGAAEETYGYYSSVQMASYALGYPIVTGCHTVHRTSALREVGGYAAHDADDLLVTILYRAAGWRGVYVPEHLAAGITPVDWDGYLQQQRRWARSVLDVKLRIFPRVAGDLPLVERVVSALHGLYYLHGIGTAVGIGVLSLGLARGWRPAVLGTPPLAGLAVVGSLAVCEAFRQRHYLVPATERGVHVRAGVLKFAKWPTVLLAFAEAVAARRPAYAVTAKVRTGRRRPLLVHHGTAVGVVLAGMAIGVATGASPAPALEWAAATFVVLSLAVMATELVPAPPPYDDALAAAVVRQAVQ
jgi:cellulose synthase (UDP-forming)